MSERSSELPSGIRVVTEHMPAVRSVAIGLWFDVGSRDEEAGEQGCSHFLEHTLFKGTRRRSARAIAETFDGLGGELNAFTSKELTCYYARVLDRDLPVAFEVLADMVVDARNDAGEVEAERTVVRAELDALHDSPEELVHTEFCQSVFGVHPLAAETLGDATSIAALDRDTIHGYYLDRYRPGSLVVAVAGSVDHDEVVGWADQLLGDLGRPGRSEHRRAPLAGYRTGEVRLRHRPGEQVHAVLGRGGLDHRDEDRFTLKVLDTLLGGGMSSRLFQEIRERRGLAYTTFSYASSYTDAGLVGAYAATAPNTLEEVLGLLRSELDRVAEDVTPDEIARAQRALSGGLVLGLEDTGARMSRLGKQLVTGAPLVGVDEALERIGAVEVEHVRALAARVLSGPMDLAIVGPVDASDTERFRSAVA